MIKEAPGVTFFEENMTELKLFFLNYITLQVLSFKRDSSDSNTYITGSSITLVFSERGTVWGVRPAVTEFNFRFVAENETALADICMRNKNELIKSTIWQQNLIFPTSDAVNGNRRVCWYLTKEHLLSRMKISSLQYRNQSRSNVHKDTKGVCGWGEGWGKKSLLQTVCRDSASRCTLNLKACCNLSCKIQ